MVADAGAVEIRFAALTDEEVVSRVRAGETALYEVIMRRHNQRLFRAVRAILRDDDEAEDVMQEAYVRAFAQLDQFAGLAKFSTWLTKIAVHEAFARVRRRKRLSLLDTATLPDEIAAHAVGMPARDPHEDAAAREIKVALEASIDALPDGYRSVFVLREVEGLSTAETAECLELTEENVKVRLHRARAALRDDLERRLGQARPHVFEFRRPRCDRIVANVLERITPKA